MQTIVSAMDPQRLRNIIDNRDMRVAVIQQNRDSIYDITGSRPPRDPGQIPEWWDNNKSYVSRKVNQLIDNTNSEEDEDSDDEVEPEILPEDEIEDDEEETEEDETDEDNDTTYEV